MAKRTPKPTREQDIASLTAELTTLFEKYDGRLWKVRNASVIGAAVNTVIATATFFLARR